MQAVKEPQEEEEANREEDNVEDVDGGLDGEKLRRRRLTGDADKAREVVDAGEADGVPSGISDLGNLSKISSSLS